MSILVNPVDYTIPYDPNARDKTPMTGLNSERIFVNTGDFVLYSEIDISNTHSGSGEMWMDNPWMEDRRIKFIKGLILDDGSGMIGNYQSNENIQIEVRGDSDYITYNINGEDVSSYPRNGFHFSDLKFDFQDCTGNVFSVYSGQPIDMQLSTDMSGVGPTGNFWVVNNESSGTIWINSIYLDSGFGCQIDSSPSFIIPGSSGLGKIKTVDSGVFSKQLNLYVDSNAGTYKFPITFADTITGGWGEWNLAYNTNRVTNSGEIFLSFVQGVNTGVKIESIGLYKETGGSGHQYGEMFARVIGTGWMSGRAPTGTEIYGSQVITLPSATGDFFFASGGIAGNTSGEAGQYVISGLNYTVNPTGSVTGSGTVRASSVINDYEYYPAHPTGEPQYVYQTSVFKPNCTKLSYVIAFAENQVSGNQPGIAPATRKFYYFDSGDWANYWGINADGLSNLANTGVISFTRDAPSSFGGTGSGTFTGDSGSAYHTMTQFIMWAETGGDTEGFPHPTSGNWYYEDQGAIYETGCLYSQAETALTRRGYGWGNRSRAINDYDTYREAIRYIFPGTRHKIPCGALNRDGDSGIYGQETDTSIAKKTYYTDIPYTVVSFVNSINSGSIDYSGATTGSPTGGYSWDIWGNRRTVENEAYTGTVKTTLVAKWDQTEIITDIIGQKPMLVSEGTKSFTGVYNLYTGHDTGSLIDFKQTGWFNTGQFERIIPGGGRVYERYSGFLIKITYENPFTTGTVNNNFTTGDRAIFRIAVNTGDNDYNIFGIKI